MRSEDLSMFRGDGSHLSFSDQIKDDLQAERTFLQACHFRHLGLKKASIKDSDLTQCVFEDVYLRNAKFEHVKFIGSKFRNCNLEKASIKECHFNYCTFERTLLNSDAMIDNLPKEPNLKRDLARNLKKNFEGLGDKKTADVFLDIEIEAQEEDLAGAFWGHTDYYREHYPTFIKRFGAGLEFLLSKMAGIFLGYGHRIDKLIISFIILTCILGLITYQSSSLFIVDSQEPSRVLKFSESIYFAFTVMLGIRTSHFLPVSESAKLLLFILGLLRVLFLPLLAATFYRKIAR